MLTRRAGVLSALLFALPHRAEAQTSKLAGTYALWLCSKGCSIADTARAEVKGYLVLNNRPLDLRGLPTRIREYLYSQSSDLMEDELANACFSLGRQTREITMLAGAIPVGLTTWRVQRDTIRAFLYGSPDASYLLRLGVGTAAMHGRGHESGFIGSWFSNDAGNIVAVRVSTPDFSRCFADTSAIDPDKLWPNRVVRDDEKVLETLDKRDRAARDRNAEAEARFYDEYVRVFDEMGGLLYHRDSLRASLSRKYRSEPAIIPRAVWARRPSVYTINPTTTLVSTWEEWEEQSQTVRRISTVVFRREDDGEWKIFYEQKQISRLPLER